MVKGSNPAQLYSKVMNIIDGKKRGCTLSCIMDFSNKIRYSYFDDEVIYILHCGVDGNPLPFKD